MAAPQLGQPCEVPPWTRLTPELVSKIAGYLGARDAALHFKLVNKEAAESLRREHIWTFRLFREPPAHCSFALEREYLICEPRLASQPWPGPDFCAKWGRGPEPWRALSLRQRQDLLRAAASSLHPPSLDAALAHCGAAVPADALAAAAAVGDLAACERLLLREGCAWDAKLVWTAAARHGQERVCDWLRTVQRVRFEELGACLPAAACFGGHRGVLSMALEELGGGSRADWSTCALAAAEGGQPEMLAVLAPRVREPPPAEPPPAYLYGVAYGCPLAVLQQYCARWGAPPKPLLMWALASPTQDWERKCDWLLTQWAPGHQWAPSDDERSALLGGSGGSLQTRRQSRAVYAAAARQPPGLLPRLQYLAMKGLRPPVDVVACAAAAAGDTAAVEHCLGTLQTAGLLGEPLVQGAVQQQVQEAQPPQPPQPQQQPVAVAVVQAPQPPQQPQQPGVAMVAAAQPQPQVQEAAAAAPAVAPPLPVDQQLGAAAAVGALVDVVDDIIQEMRRAEDVKLLGRVAEAAAAAGQVQVLRLLEARFPQASLAAMPHALIGLYFDGGRAREAGGLPAVRHYLMGAGALPDAAVEAAAENWDDVFSAVAAHGCDLPLLQHLHEQRGAAIDLEAVARGGSAEQVAWALAALADLDSRTYAVAVQVERAMRVKFLAAVAAGSADQNAAAAVPAVPTPATLRARWLRAALTAALEAGNWATAEALLTRSSQPGGQQQLLLGGQPGQAAAAEAFFGLADSFSRSRTAAMDYPNRIPALRWLLANLHPPSLDAALAHCGAAVPADALAAAACVGDLAACERLLLREGCAWHARMVWTAAARHGHERVCDWLRTVQLGSSCDIVKATVMEAACRSGYQAMERKALAELGAEGPLHAGCWAAEAAEGGHEELVEELLHDVTLVPGREQRQVLYSVAYGCSLGALRQRYEQYRPRDASCRMELLLRALGSPRPDWAAKCSWLLAQMGTMTTWTRDDACPTLWNFERCCQYAARQPDYVQRLQWLLDAGIRLPPEAGVTAAATGNVEAVALCLDNPLPERLMTEGRGPDALPAALLELLRWEQGQPQQHPQMRMWLAHHWNLLLSGVPAGCQLQINRLQQQLQEIHGNLMNNMAAAAADAGQLSVLRLLWARGLELCPSQLVESMLQKVPCIYMGMHAAGLRTLRGLVMGDDVHGIPAAAHPSNNISWAEVFRAAARSGCDLPLLRHLHEQRGAAIDLEAVARGGSAEQVAWALAALAGTGDTSDESQQAWAALGSALQAGNWAAAETLLASLQPPVTRGQVQELFCRLAVAKSGSSWTACEHRRPTHIPALHWISQRFELRWPGRMRQALGACRQAAKAAKLGMPAGQQAWLEQLVQASEGRAPAVG
ncbi:hypothetical protein HYH02_006639 [Chlamydomonas schloesseri]|uniref:Uncharacterized protein n=1 Tax=Chlamydomonas schloesseri TaxID=2026947 RepID=A0A835T557_9CHLO|nr:hypothetical protein HYH02_006639 [Chlamydomonas schloesseri]|eukprot:KAG2439117.1 hypothetical protein HYH02_006639 [Chlamydomonas schloesseri]